MKSLLLMMFLGCFLFSKVVSAQSAKKVYFTNRCVPTSTDSYSIEIFSDRFILKSRQLILNKRGIVRNVDTSTYVHWFNDREGAVVDSIIQVNQLDSVGLYLERKTEWGKLWEVVIQDNAITYRIDLPNYNNDGLSALIQYVLCLVPKKNLPRFVCDKCPK